MTWSSTLSAKDSEYQIFEMAMNAFNAGLYEEAATRFNAMLKTETENPALLLECHKFIAVSKLFIGDKESAEHHFLELLTISPEYTLDPMIFPIEIIDFFTEIKAKNKKQLEALALARAREKANLLAEQAARKLAEKEALMRNVYLEKEVKKNSLAVAMIPCGAGQFQNGDKLKGALFLSGELLLAAAAITTYALHESLRSDSKQPYESKEKRKQAESRELGLRIANHASIAALVTLAVGGIVDALVHYRPQVVTWKTLKEKDVPKPVRPGGSQSKHRITPGLDIGTGSVHLSLTGTF
ncbi:MAG: hypothetical protein GY762_07140 [Proteobacteria bacterium]|nr:hypothetical protein [Pseudomonadota bacterium]